MNEEMPTLVVVGRVNRGKSSILSTLAEDDSIRVSSDPGTTREVHRYPLRVNGREMFELVDTPGFEDAPRALRFLKEREESAANRRELVRSFVAHFEGSGEFEQECRLLRPILDGGAILYVVDGSHPYRSNYEAEMEILRWTGQPRIALINRTSGRDCTEEWRAVLDQYFSIVRIFDAHHAGFRDRIGLLQALREVNESWRGRFDEAIGALQKDWGRRRREAAGVIAGFITEELLHTRSIVLKPEEKATARRKEIEQKFHDDLRELEEKARRKVEEVYRHTGLVRNENPMPQPVLDEDLFSKKTWETLGLSLPELAGLGLVTGAGTGGALDIMTGGTLFGAGLLFGSLIGGGAALYYGTARMETAGDFLSYFRGGRRLLIGPHRNPNFPWVLLDRALFHYVSVRDRAHGKRDPLELGIRTDASGKLQGFAATLSDEERRRIGKVFAGLRKRGGASRREEYEGDLSVILAKVLHSAKLELSQEKQ